MRKIVMASALTLLAIQGFYSPSGALTLAAAQPKAAAHAVSSEPLVILAQDVAVDEQVRQLNGRIEEMSFQILQLQEQLRKTQEDNEFRFQELEKGKKSGALDKPVDGQGHSQDTAASSGEPTPEATPSFNDTATLDQAGDVPAATGETDPAAGTPAVDLGSIKLDDQGKVVGTEPAPQQNTDDQASLSGDPVEKIIETSPATAPSGDGADALYQAAYEHVLSGDYSAAEGQFRDYIQSHPEGAKIADANFWLGESQYSQAKYSEAAKTFLNAYKSYGKSEKAPEMLLKLAMSLAALESKDTACATLREVPKTYPKASRAVISKVASEQKRLAC